MIWTHRTDWWSYQQQQQQQLNELASVERVMGKVIMGVIILRQKHGVIFLHQIMPIFLACSRHEDSQYIRDV